MRVTAFVVALLVATSAAAQTQPKLEIGTRQGNYYWVVETAADGSRRGGWVSVNVPLDAIDRSTFKPLPAESVSVEPPQAPPVPPTIDERLARIEQALAGKQAPVQPQTRGVQLAPAVQTSQTSPRPQGIGPSNERLPMPRGGFWFSGGLGFGTLTCEGCDNDYVGGLSGGLAAGTTVNSHLLIGAGTTGWSRTIDGVNLSAGTFDFRVRVYPSDYHGFFINGGVGIGRVALDLGSVTISETGSGAMFGLGWDIKTGRNVSVTPFWNGSAISAFDEVWSFGQIGLGITIH